MQPQLVLRKTPAGAEEMRRNALGLGPRVRRVLIQIDGHRTIAQLLHDNAGALDVTAAIEQLLKSGLVAPLEGADAAPDVPVQAAHVQSIPDGSPRDALVQMAETLLGAKAASQVVLKLQATADTPEALSGAIDSCARLIKLFIDEDKAADFRRQANVILGQSQSA